MDKTISDDFAAFINDNDLFNSDVIMYEDATKSKLLFEGRGTYDKKPNLVENESGMIGYMGHKASVAFSMSQITTIDNYFSLEGYYAEITDNLGMIAYLVTSSSYSNNVGSIFCYLKEV